MCRPRSNLGTFSQPHFTSWRQLFGDYFITILLCWSSSLIRVHPDRVLHFHHLIFQDLPPLANPQRFFLHPRQPLWGGCLPPGTNGHVQSYVWFPSPTPPWFADSIVLDVEETPTLYGLVFNARFLPDNGWNTTSAECLPSHREAATRAKAPWHQ